MMPVPSGVVAIVGADVQVIRKFFRPFTPEIEHLARLFNWPDDVARQYFEFEWMKLVLKLGDNTEVAAAAAYCPEQVGILILTEGSNGTVGGDDLRGF